MKKNSVFLRVASRRVATYLPRYLYQPGVQFRVIRIRFQRRFRRRNSPHARSSLTTARWLNGPIVRGARTRGITLARGATTDHHREKSGSIGRGQHFNEFPNEYSEISGETRFRLDAKLNRSFFCAHVGTRRDTSSRSARRDRRRRTDSHLRHRRQHLVCQWRCQSHRSAQERRDPRPPVWQQDYSRTTTRTPREWDTRWRQRIQREKDRRGKEERGRGSGGTGRERKRDGNGEGR